MSDRGDRYALLQAVELDGRHFDGAPSEKSVRLARAIGLAADAIRVELRDGTDDDEREFADRLDVLRLVPGATRWRGFGT